MRILCYTVGGYLLGGILFARVFSSLFHCEEAIDQSRDGNPGTANAFVHCGFWCGVLTLLGDLLKGILPVHLFLMHTGGAEPPIGLALVMAAPVLGHVCPIYTHFRGGKGIATTFGCLIGLLPMGLPLLLLIFFFLLFTLCIRVNPHLHRTVLTYLCTTVGLLLCRAAAPVLWGFLLISSVVCLKLWCSRDANEKVEVRLLWMR